jgi:hypothetical protein
MRISSGAVMVMAVLGSRSVGVGMSCSKTSAAPDRQTPPRLADPDPGGGKAPPPGDGKPPENGSQKRTQKATQPGTQNGIKMAPEAILTKHYADNGWGKPVELVPYERVPYLYRVDFSDKGDYAVVHNGKVLDRKGLDAMAGYMKDVKLMSQAKLQSEDIIGLLLAFHAFPAVKDIDPEGYYALDKLPRLRPRLELGADEGRFTLSYVFPNVGGAVPNPSVVTVKQWTMEIPKTYAARWHEQTLKVDISKP